MPFTPGSVLFADSLGNIGEDNANFFWDSTNKRLGIGTKTPSARIELANLGLTSGDGVLLKNPTTYDVLVPSAQVLSLANLRFHNQQTTQGASVFYGLVLTTDSEAIDTAAGVAVFNNGRSDNIYLNVAGKAGAATNNSPSGVGIDLKKAPSGTGENSSTHGGVGVIIFDWSTTNIGVGGPRGIFIKKQGNSNTDHRALHIEANRWALQLTTPEGLGYDANQVLIEVDSPTSGVKWQLLAGGSQLLANTRSVLFNMATGNQGYIMGTSANWLELRGGSTGVRILNNAGTLENLKVTDAGLAVLGGNAELLNNKGVFFDPVTGNQGYILLNASNQLDIRGGPGGLRVLNNAGAVENLKVTDAGLTVFGGSAEFLNNKGVFLDALSGNQAYLVLNASNQLDARVGLSGMGVINNSGAAALVQIQNGGNVGIGTSPAFKLDVAGAAHATSFPVSSDLRFKKKIQPLRDSLNKLLAVRGVAFEWNDRYEQMARATPGRHVGVVAQDVERVLPELVVSWGDEEWKAVDYGR